MDKIIVYVDDASYALGQLKPMLLGERRAQWVLVACAPRLTRHASKWVPRDACEAWRRQWADMAFATLGPVLQSRGDAVETMVANGSLHEFTEKLVQRFGPARILDARRPKFGHHLPKVLATQEQTDGSSRWQLPLALASVGAMLTLVGD